MSEPQFLFVPASLRFAGPVEALERFPVQCEGLPSPCEYCEGKGCGEWVLLPAPHEAPVMGQAMKQNRLEWARAAAAAAVFNRARAIESVELVLEVVAAEREDRFLPRERRALARKGKGGRRAALPVPMAVRWEARVYAPKGAPVELLEQSFEKRMQITRCVWSCEGWRRGAYIWAEPGEKMRAMMTKLAPLIAEGFMDWVMRPSMLSGLLSR